MRKIAIPSNENIVDDHFGHCQYYTIFTLDENNSIAKKEILPSPAGCGCKSDIASILSNMNVLTMLAGNMGEGAINNLTRAGLNVYRGYRGNVEEVLNSFLDGNLGTETVCQNNHDHGDNGHSCSH